MICQTCGKDETECTCNKVAISPETYEAVKKKVLETVDEIGSDSEIALALREMLCDKLESHGIHIVPSEIRTKADMARYTQIVRELEEKQLLAEGDAPVGTAPPNPTIGGEIIRNNTSNLIYKGYANYKEMIKDLRARERLGDPESKKILDALFRKHIAEHKQTRNKLTQVENYSEKINEDQNTE
jgi:Tat protein secretion system quality control protein TatD with DNase activity